MAERRCRLLGSRGGSPNMRLPKHAALFGSTEQGFTPPNQARAGRAVVDLPVLPANVQLSVWQPVDRLSVSHSPRQFFCIWWHRWLGMPLPLCDTWASLSKVWTDGGVYVSAGTLEIIGTILVAIIGAAGTSIAALISYQTWRQKKQPVIAGIDEWREVVSAQRVWLNNIDTYIRILGSGSVQSAIGQLRRYTWELAFQREQARLREMRVKAENIKRMAGVKSAEYITRTTTALQLANQAISAGDAAGEGKELELTSEATQEIIRRQANEIASSEAQKADQLLTEVREGEKINAERHNQLPEGRLSGMFTEEPAPALLQLRQGRAATAACRDFNSTIERLRTLVEEPPRGSAIMRSLDRRRSTSYLKKAIALLSRAQANLTEISYLKPALLGSTDSEESPTA